MRLGLMGRTGIRRRSRCTTGDVAISRNMWADWVRGIDFR